MLGRKTDVLHQCDVKNVKALGRDASGALTLMMLSGIIEPYYPPARTSLRYCRVACAGTSAVEMLHLAFDESVRSYAIGKTSLIQLRCCSATTVQRLPLPWRSNSDTTVFCTHSACMLRRR